MSKYDGFLIGDVYITLPLDKNEYEEYFQSNKLSFNKAYEIALENNRKVSASFLKDNYKEKIMELYNDKTLETRDDIDAAGLMFKYPVFAKIGVSTEIDGIEFFIDFSSFYDQEREKFLEIALYNGERYVELELSENIVNEVKTAYSQLSSKDKVVFNAIYNEVKDMGEFNALEKVYIAVANTLEGEAKLLETINELGEYYMQNYMDESLNDYIANSVYKTDDARFLEKLGLDLINGVVPSPEEIYVVEDEGILVIPELDCYLHQEMYDKIYSKVNSNIDYNEER